MKYNLQLLNIFILFQHIVRLIGRPTIRTIRKDLRPFYVVFMNIILAITS